MTARVIDGKAFAAGVRARVKAAAAALKAQHDLTIGLTVVLVGEDPGSQIYVRNKGIAARDTGLVSNEILLPASTSEASPEARTILTEDRDRPGATSILPFSHKSVAVNSSIEPGQRQPAFTETSTDPSARRASKLSKRSRTLAW